MIFLGYRNAGAERWKNADGKESDFVDWKQGQPDQNSEDGAQTGWDFNGMIKWHDVRCDRGVTGYSCRFEK